MNKLEANKKLKDLFGPESDYSKIDVYIEFISGGETHVQTYVVSSWDDDKKNDHVKKIVDEQYKDQWEEFSWDETPIIS